MKRYCQTLTLVDDEDMIEKYVKAHAHVWPEVIAGQHGGKVGEKNSNNCYNYIYLTTWRDKWRETVNRLDEAMKRAQTEKVAKEES